MNLTQIQSSRRAFLGTLAFGADPLYCPGRLAEELTRTPTTFEGPYFPKKLLTTECFIKGFQGNQRDGQFNQIRLRDPKGHETLCVDFAPVKGSRIGELAARWDIVLGFSPET